MHDSSEHRRLLQNGYVRAYHERQKAKGIPRKLTKHEHTCVVCGSPFLTRKPSPKYCSVACQVEGKYAEVRERNRQRLLPILHPNPAPYSRLPANHPVVLMQQGHARLFIANTCIICGEGFITLHVRHATCGSERCVAEKRRAERRARKAYERALTRGQRPGVFNAREWGGRLLEYDGACAYCGSDLCIEIEHVIPLCRGGSNLIANVVPACHECNQDKGSMMPEEWRESGSRRAALVVQWPLGDSQVALTR
jgi:5-methylcytosine-specific restriction endonuclease McrA